MLHYFSVNIVDIIITNEFFENDYAILLIVIRPLCQERFLRKRLRFYSTLPVPIKRFHKLRSVIRKFLAIFFIFILYVRSFFLKDRTYHFHYFFVPMITTIILYLAKEYPENFSGFTAAYVFIWLGIQLIVYDALGSKISFNALNDIDPILSVTTLIVFTKKNNLVRYVSVKALTAIIVGKTPMTATGRASLIVGTFTGGAWLYNCAADRKAASMRADDDRKAADIRANADRKVMQDESAKQRAYQNYQYAQQEYRSQPFYKKKGEKPQWDEEQWNQWSKTK